MHLDFIARRSPPVKVGMIASRLHPMEMSAIASWDQEMQMTTGQGQGVCILPSSGHGHGDCVLPCSCEGFAHGEADKSKKTIQHFVSSTSRSSDLGTSQPDMTQCDTHLIATQNNFLLPCFIEGDFMKRGTAEISFRGRNVCFAHTQVCFVSL